MPLGDNFTKLIETSFNSNPFNKCHVWWPRAAIAKIYYHQK